MARITSAGIGADLPSGWEGQASEGGLQTVADGSIRPNVLHIANFPLPPRRGDYGSGAVDVMEAGDALIVLLEFQRESTTTALFSVEGRPSRLEATDFDPSALQWGRPGMSGVQRFFHESGRAFCLYVVMGSHIDRRDLLPEINQIIGGLEITA